MKRYNVYENSDARESIDGAWVLHSDHEAAIQAAVAAERDMWSSAVAKHCSMEIVQNISNELRNANENRTPT